MKVILDAGHAIVGAVGARGTGRSEEMETRKVVTKLSAMLKEKGHIVVNASCDKEKDRKLQLKKIVAIADKHKDADVFLSVHLNSFSNPTAQGLETYHCPGSRKGKEWATKIQSEVLKGIKWVNRGVKEANFYVLKNTTPPAVLVELGFITNKEDMQKFDLDKICRSLFKALTGKEYAANKPTVVDKNKIYKVQCGAFRDRSNADNLIMQLKKEGFKDCFVVEV